MRNFILIISLLIFALGCGEPIERTDLIGEYVSNKNDSQEILIIKEDGTYLHQISDLKETNKWEYDEVDKEYNQLSLYFLTIENGKTIDRVGVERSLSGKIRLAVDRDLNYFFEKK